MKIKHRAQLIVLLLLCTLISSCSHPKGLWPALTSPDVLMINHHIRHDQRDIEQFCRRLYLKNPIYEHDLQARERKLHMIFHPQPNKADNAGAARPQLSTTAKTSGSLPFATLPSHKLLEAAFTPTPPVTDRIYLLALGMNKSISEAYDNFDKHTLLSGIQLDVKKLEHLYANLQQLNWRLKTYRDQEGKLLFLTNAYDNSGYINMGYEVIMTRLLTRTADDIYLRNGQTPNFIFNMSTLFLPIIL